MQAPGCHLNKIFDFLNWLLWVCLASVCVCALCVCWVPTEARRLYWLPWSWSWIWLSAAVWVLGFKPYPTGPSVRAVRALNCQSISLVLRVLCLIEYLQILGGILNDIDWMKNKTLTMTSFQSYVSVVFRVHLWIYSQSWFSDESKTLKAMSTAKSVLPWPGSP